MTNVANSQFRWMNVMFSVLLLAVVTQAQTPAVSLVPEITTFAGNGTQAFGGDGGAAASAKLNNPYGVAMDSVGNLYLADNRNHRVRKVNAATGVITTVAGNGVAGFSGDGGRATSAELFDPYGVALDSSNNLYIADAVNQRIRKVNSATGIITTVAGSGRQLFAGDGGPATSAALNDPFGIAVDSVGNLYIADNRNHRIRKVNASTGVITTVAGNGVGGFSGDGGKATSAALSDPFGVAVDFAGNLYIADSQNHRIRKVNAATGVITTVAGNGAAGHLGDGGAATSAELNAPNGISVDLAGNLYIADSLNNRIRQVSAATGVITTVAGNGTFGNSGDTGAATGAELNEPPAVAVDSAGNLFIADIFNNRVRKVSGATAPVNFLQTAVGSASASQKVLLRLNSALKITSISVPKSQGGKQEITVGTIAGCVANGTTSNAAGSVCTVPVTFHPGYPGSRQLPLQVQTSEGTFNFGITGMGQGPLPALLPGIITTGAGSGLPGLTGDGGQATSAELNNPFEDTVDSLGNQYFSTDSSRIRKVDAATGVITTVAGNGTQGYGGDGGPATSAEFFDPGGLAVDAAGNLYIADFDNSRVRKVSANTGIITTVAGNGTPGYSGDGGPATSAELSYPYSVAVDTAGNLYIADWLTCIIRKVSAATGVITTVVGNGNAGYTGDGGPATQATLAEPNYVVVDSSGNLFISDFSNNVIRKVNASTGIITTVAGIRLVGKGDEGGFSGDGGPATSAELNFSFGIAVDSAGNLYISDTANFALRKVSAATGVITTLAGRGANGLGDGGPATDSELSALNGVAVDPAGNLYLADSGNSRIRKISVATPPLSFPATVVGSHSGAQTVDVANLGNAALKVSGITPSTNFKTNASTTTCSTSSAVAVGNSCAVGVAFSPSAVGTHNGTLTLTDNALNVTGATQKVTLSGTGK